MTEIPVAVAASSALKLRKVAAWQGIRVLAWDGDILYGCRGYQVVRLQIRPQVDRPHIAECADWEPVASYRPVWWRNLTSRSTLTYRLMRDGFHALAILSNRQTRQTRQTNDRTMVGAVPGALVTRTPNSDEFHVTHQVQRGIRPLHVTAVPSGTILTGESISTIASAPKFTSTLRPIADPHGRLRIRFPLEAYGTSTTLFMIVGAIAFGF